MPDEKKEPQGEQDPSQQVRIDNNLGDVAEKLSKRMVEEVDNLSAHDLKIMADTVEQLKQYVY